MKSNWYSHAICSSVLLVGGLSIAQADGPLPEFTFQGVALHPDDLSYAPTGELIHPTIIKIAGRVQNALGKYYLYYAPHKHVAISMAYSDSMDGPWIQYKGNPVIKGPSAPDIRWIEDESKFFMWGHTKNNQTECWTSEDGIRFEHQGVSITAKKIGTRNATYSRMYEYPLQRYGSKYIMLYSGFIVERGIRCVWLAYSKDARNWVQEKTPLVEPVEGENNDCYGPSLLRWDNRNFVVYQDHTTWRGGNIKYVELDQELNPVGAGGKRYLLLDPPAEPPLNDRYRGGEFYFESGKLYLYSSASKNPRIIVYATAELEDTLPMNNEGKGQENDKGREKPNTAFSLPKDQQEVVSAEAGSLDELLKGLELRRSMKQPSMTRSR